MYVLFYYFVVMIKPFGLMALHFKCRGGTYPRSAILRLEVPEDKVNWTVPFVEYNPPTFNALSSIGKPWADLDKDDPNFAPKWNLLDGKVNRISHNGTYLIENGSPLNPIGRTGIQGRGILGRWGPNHAADPVVTRWKQQESGAIAKNNLSNKPILQFIAIKRGDNGQWALPGGMVDPGEKVAATAMREFQEEATNSLMMSDDEKVAWKGTFEKFFSDGDVVYSGYVDDPRNTDNAWMETVAYNFHDELGTAVGDLRLHAGDDAVGVQWLDVGRELQLYASHMEIVKKVAELRKANW